MYGIERLEGYIPAELLRRKTSKRYKMNRYSMMVRIAETKSGYKAFFYDKVTKVYVGESEDISLGSDINSAYTPVRKYPFTAIFKGLQYDSFVYEK